MSDLKGLVILTGLRSSIFFNSPTMQKKGVLLPLYVDGINSFFSCCTPVYCEGMNALYVHVLLFLHFCIICLYALFPFFFFQKYIFYLLEDVAHDLGWEERKEDDHLKR